MDMSGGEIPKLIVSNVPRGALDSISEALYAGAYQAHKDCRSRAEGHLPSVLGLARHFWMNETFYEALSASGLSPSALAGNRIVTGTSGIVTIARFNTKEARLEKGRRSKSRLKLAEANRIVESLTQPGLFESRPSAPTSLAAFFVASFAASPQMLPEKPVKIEIAVPSINMDKWLFCEAIEHLMARYEAPVLQADRVRPKLKKSAQNQDVEGDAS